MSAFGATGGRPIQAVRKGRFHRGLPAGQMGAGQRVCRAGPACRCAVTVLTVILGCLWVALGNRAHAQPAASPPTEYQVKAVYLYNFAKFVEWPSQKFPQPGSPVIIGLVGEEAHKIDREPALKGKTANGRPLVFRRCGPGDDFEPCHILFISRSALDRVESILAQVKTESILTVGETDRFAERGGVINFILVDEAVKFEINPQAAAEAGLKISSKLFNVGKIVKPGLRKEAR